VASFVPPLTDPGNPNAVANWAREVADVINGQISIGEPLATLADGTEGLDTLRPNGVKGHLLGSFVEIEIGNVVLPPLVTPVPCVHNLDIPNKVAGGLNVGWVVVRVEHKELFPGNTTLTSVPGVYYETGDAVTNNSIELRFVCMGARSITDARPLKFTLWFFPTTR